MYEMYSIKREPEYGNLFVVRHRGDKIGMTQTEHAAKMIRRRHYNGNHERTCTGMSFIDNRWVFTNECTCRQRRNDPEE